MLAVDVGPEILVQPQPDLFQPVDTVVADFDGDGDADVAVQAIDRIAWYENLDGQGGFGPQQTIAFGISSRATSGGLDAGDLDLDGDVDVVVAGRNGLLWYENFEVAGVGRFWRAHRISETAGEDLTLGDFDRDGDSDFLVVDVTSSEFRFFENRVQQHGSVEVVLHALPLPFAASSVRGVYPALEVADVDGDGNLDALVAATRTVGLWWYENSDVTGAFDPTARFITDEIADATSLAAGDFRIQGEVEIAVATRGGEVFVVESLHGPPPFSNVQVSSLNDWLFRAHVLLVADVNEDGQTDLIGGRTDCLGNPACPSAISLLPSRDGWFARAQALDGGFAPVTSLAMDDLDADGDADLVYSAISMDRVAWIENLGRLPFGPRHEVTFALESATSVFAADVDSDGDLDLIEGDSAGAIWFENLDGAGTFSDRRILYEGDRLLAVGDVDGDGDVDLVVGSQHIYWVENLEGSFSPLLSSLVAGNAGVHWGRLDDVDGDGDLDLVTSTLDQGSFTRDRLVLQWWENIGGRGAFGPARPIFDEAGAGPRWGPPLTADLDNDGDLDFLAALPDGRLVALINRGDNGFAEQTVAMDVAVADSFQLADFDGDGYVDVLHLTEADALYWFRNSGPAIRFDDRQLLTPLLGGDGDLVGVATVVDIDFDGRPDIVYGDSARIVWRGNEPADGELLQPEAVLANSVVINPSVLTADLNGDGQFDLVAQNATGALSWFPGRREDSHLPGDFSGDGIVGQQDLDLVLLQWGKSAASVPLEWRGELPQGIVSQGELDQVLANWGATAPDQPTAFVVSAPLRTAARDRDTQDASPANALSGIAVRHAHTAAMDRALASYVAEGKSLGMLRIAHNGVRR